MKIKIIALFILLIHYNINAQLKPISNYNVGLSLLPASEEHHPNVLKKSLLSLDQEPIDLTYGEGTSAVFKSLAVPGWGLHTAANSPKYGKKLFLLAPVCYGTVGFGIYSRIKSKNMYDRYLNATDQSEIGEYYTQATKSYSHAVIFTSIGAALWVGQALLTYIYGKRNDDYRERLELWGNNKNTSFTISPEYDPFSGSVVVQPKLTINLK